MPNMNTLSKSFANSSVMGKFFRYPIDVIPVLVVLVFFACQLALFFLVDNMVWIIAIVFALSLIQGVIVAANHNHHHLNYFRNKYLNRILEIIMYLQTGTSPYTWTLHHNLGHHKMYLDPKNEPAKWMREDGTVMGEWEYTLITTWNIYPKCFEIGKKHKNILKYFIIFLFIANVPLVLLFMLDFYKTLWIFFIPMIMMLIRLSKVTYGHHAGRNYKDVYQASVTDTNKYFNLITFNAGYHLAHHLKEKIHWSRLDKTKFHLQ